MALEQKKGWLAFFCRVFGHLAGGCLVPGGLSGFLLLLFLHDPSIAFLILHQDLMFHSAQRVPIRESCCFFTSHRLIMN